jgi:hypothetical protein
MYTPTERAGWQFPKNRSTLRRDRLPSVAPPGIGLALRAIPHPCLRPRNPSEETKEQRNVHPHKQLHHFCDPTEPGLAWITIAKQSNPIQYNLREQ